MTDNRNPLLQDWQTPYQLPPFHQIRPEHFAPAFAALFEQHLAEIDALADNQAAPTFYNTVAAFDAAGAALDRVRLTLENLCASESPAALQAVEREMAPLLAARDRGYAVGVLQASEMGYPVYAHMGFTEQFRYRNYYWKPD